MNILTLLEMYDHERNSIISSHRFYVEQAEKRILSQFNNLDDEFEQIAQEIFDKLGNYFDPENDDPADFADAAGEKADDHLYMLSEMREQTVLSVIGGMYHQFDKEIREWIERESRLWAGKVVKEQLWKIDIGRVYNLLESFGWDLTNHSFFRYLDACRLIVNVYKHGKGKALTDLRKNYPEYFYDFNDPNYSSRGWYDHNSIRITDEQFTEISDAIVAFWEAVPRRFMNNHQAVAPKWLEDALKAENKN